MSQYRNQILKTKFHRHQTTSMILVSVGVIIVGIMESLSKDEKGNKVSIEYYFYFLDFHFVY